MVGAYQDVYVKYWLVALVGGVQNVLPPVLPTLIRAYVFRFDPS
jgi:hypothetical protein